MNRFEDRVHNDAGASRASSRSTTSPSAWLETQRDLLGDSVDVTDDYGSWWSYVPHFVDTPGYVYAYAYGHLLALSVYRRYQERGEGFVPSYLDLLRAGGSRSPEDLGKIVGVDLTDPGFWQSGLDLIAEQLDARRAGRIGSRPPLTLRASLFPPAPVAQSDRASVYETEGHRFESCRARFAKASFLPCRCGEPGQTGDDSGTGSAAAGASSGISPGPGGATGRRSSAPSAPITAKAAATRNAAL